MNKIYFVIGTKAQFIKCKPVINYIADKCNVVVLLTNQHKDFLDKFMIEIDPNIEIIDFLQNNNSLDTIFKNIKWFVFSVFKIITNKTFKPEVNSLIINHGDTLSALLGVILALKHRVKKLHLEAGLRSGKFFKPFPEEIIRKLVSLNSNYLVADGPESFQNLNKYFKTKNLYTTTINTAYDNLDIENIDTYSSSNEIIILMHRSENIFSKKKLKKFVEYLIQLQKYHSDSKFIWIMHPSTESQLLKYNLNIRIKDTIEIYDLMEHKKFISMLKNSLLFITDSLSAEFESFVLRKKTVVWRNSFINRYDLDSFLYITKKNLLDSSISETSSLINSEIEETLSVVNKPSFEFYEIIKKIGY
jgi:UDP-N-acetylglucosamine 2-epimerase (non-hydrolysing)